MNEMETILRFIIDHGLVLFRGCAFRFKNSEYERLNLVSVTLASADVECSFVVCDRDFGPGIAVLFKSRHDTTEGFGFNLSVIREFLTGEQDRSVTCDRDQTAFLDANWKTILELFSKEKMPGTYRGLMGVFWKQRDRHFRKHYPKVYEAWQKESGYGSYFEHWQAQQKAKTASSGDTQPDSVDARVSK